MITVNRWGRCLLAAVALCSASVTAVKAQDNPLPVPNTPALYDVAPVFPGGSSAMLLWFHAALERDTAIHSSRSGQVLIDVVISRKGQVREVIPVNGVPGAPEYLHGVVRAARQMPRWQPATLRGRRVEARIHLAIPVP